MKNFDMHFNNFYLQEGNHCWRRFHDGDGGLLWMIDGDKPVRSSALKHIEAWKASIR
jgi:hypothetical protein